MNESTNQFRLQSGNVFWAEATDTECSRDLDKLNLVQLGYAGLALWSSPFSILPPAALKNYVCFKSGQK